MVVPLALTPLTIVPTFAPAAAAAAALKTAENSPEHGSAVDASDELLYRPWYMYFFWLFIELVGLVYEAQCSGEVRPTTTSLSHRCDAFQEVQSFSCFESFWRFFGHLARPFYLLTYGTFHMVSR